MAEITPRRKLKPSLSTLGDDALRIFMTTGNFTKGAEDEARRQEPRRIPLLDLDKFEGTLD